MTETKGQHRKPATTAKAPRAARVATPAKVASAANLLVKLVPSTLLTRINAAFERLDAAETETRAAYVRRGEVTDRLDVIYTDLLDMLEEAQRQGPEVERRVRSAGRGELLPVADCTSPLEAKTADGWAKSRTLEADLAAMQPEIDAHDERRTDAKRDLFTLLQEYVTQRYQAAAVRFIGEQLVPMLAVSRELRQLGGSTARGDMILKHTELPYYQDGRRDCLYDVRGPRFHLMGDDAREKLEPANYGELLGELLGELRALTATNEGA